MVIVITGYTHYMH